MRLREIEVVLKENIHFLTSNDQRLDSNNHRITGFRKAIAAARRIKETGTLQEETAAVLSITAIANSAMDEVVVNNDIYTSFNSALQSLRKSATLLQRVLSDTLPPQEEDTISVKLPPDLDLKGLAKTSTDLDKVLTQALVNPYVKGEIELLGFDQGSEWLDISLGSTLAFKLLAGMVNLVSMFRTKEVEIGAKKEMVRNLKIQNDAMEEIQRALQHELDEYRQQSLQELFEVGGIPVEENELRERVKHSVKLLSDLISRGLEVHPSLVAPAEIRKNFPDPRKLLAALRELPEKVETNSQ